VLQLTQGKPAQRIVGKEEKKMFAVDVDVGVDVNIDVEVKSKNGGSFGAETLRSN